MKRLFKKEFFIILSTFIIIGIVTLTTAIYAKQKTTASKQKYLEEYSYNERLSNDIRYKSSIYMNDYISNDPRPLTHMGPYSTYGNFLYYEDHKLYSENDRLELDDHGIPKVMYSDGEYHYNAVTDAQYAFSLYADYLKTNDEKLKEEFLYAADFLHTLQSEDGSFKYEFEWQNFNSKEKYPKGWVSSMAQGHALSVYARAYHLSKDKKYIEYGNKVFDFLLLPKEQGGTMTTLEDLDPNLKDNIFFEEYVSTPNSYTLNGYMFTLFGIYDWATIEKDFPELGMKKNASYYFDEGIESLKLVLPYYDIDGFSSYDLGHIVYKNDGHIVPSYHSIHIIELANLYSVTGDKTLEAYQVLWTKYIKDYKINNYAKYIPVIAYYILIAL